MPATDVPAVPPRARAWQRRLHEDGGFTLVELVICLVIIGILMAIAVPTFRGAKRTAALKTTVAAAQSYKEAIGAFALDHDGRVPNFGTADWPPSIANQNMLTAGGLAVSPGAGGPVYPRDLTNGSGPTLPYMRGGIPQPVASGQVQIGTSFDPATAGTATGTIVYQTLKPGEFQLQVYARSGTGTSDWKLVCTTGNTDKSSDC